MENVEVKNEVNAAETIEKLKKLGFKMASSKIEALAEMKRKLKIAYYHFRVVRPEKVAAFNVKLKEKTLTHTPQWGGNSYQVLEFMPVEQWDKVPPADVLEKMEAAQEMKCFDRFEVAYIRDVKDPIIFGRIEGCEDRFHIAEWDNDCSIADLLQLHEG